MESESSHCWQEPFQPPLLVARPVSWRILSIIVVLGMLLWYHLSILLAYLEEIPMALNVLELPEMDQKRFLHASLAATGVLTLFNGFEKTGRSYETNYETEFSLKTKGSSERVNVNTTLTFFRSSLNQNPQLTMSQVPITFRMMQKPYFMKSLNIAKYNVVQISDVYQEIYDNACEFLSREGIFSQDNALKLILLTSTLQTVVPVYLDNPDAKGSYSVQGSSRGRFNIDTQLEYVFRGYALEDVLFIEMFNIDMDSYDEVSNMPFEWKKRLLSAGKDPFKR